jgi:hypothetical protein
MCNRILIVLSSLHHHQDGLTIEEPDKIMLYSEVTRAKDLLEIRSLPRPNAICNFFGHKRLPATCTPY